VPTNLVFNWPLEWLVPWFSCFHSTWKKDTVVEVFCAAGRATMRKLEKSNSLLQTMKCKFLHRRTHLDLFRKCCPLTIWMMSQFTRLSHVKTGKFL